MGAMQADRKVGGRRRKAEWAWKRREEVWLGLEGWKAGCVWLAVAIEMLSFHS